MSIEKNTKDVMVHRSMIQMTENLNNGWMNGGFTSSVKLSTFIESEYDCVI